MVNSEFDNLKVCHVNCQSLFAHIDEFRSHFMSSRYHIICLSETWLKPLMSDQMVDFHGYQLFRRDRIGRNGGGVAFYLSFV